MNEYTFDEICVGDEFRFKRDITIEMENRFRDLTGDLNPLHMDDLYAFEISGGRYKKHVSFGMLTASLYSTLAGMFIPGKYSLIHSFDELSFLEPVFEGDELEVIGVVADMEPLFRLIRVNATIIKQTGKTVSRAKIKILVMK